MSSDLERAEAKIKGLERELGELRGTPEERRIAGRQVMTVFGIIVAAALAAAFGIWAAARKPWIPRPPEAPPPSLARLDTAGQAIVIAVSTCFDPGSKDVIDVKLRLKVTPSGTAGLLETNITPADSPVTPCARQAASRSVIPATNDPQLLDLIVEVRSSRDDAGFHVVQSKWTATPPRQNQ